MDIKSVVLSENLNTIELLKLYLNEYGKFEFLEGMSEYSKAFELIKEHKNLLVLVDISKYQEQALNFVAKVNTDFPDCKIVVFSENPDTDLVIKAMRFGAEDFVTVPVIKKDLFQTFDKIYDYISGNKSKKSKCKVLSVYSNKGGIGKTSIATNLALELAKITKENVALVDLNFYAGDVTTFLDLKPSFNISYMFQNLNKINSDFLLSTLEKYKDTSLYILADPPFFKQTESISIKNISQFFDIMKETFSYVVVDTSPNFDARTIQTLKESDLIMFATIVNLPALRNCQRCLDLFEKTGFKKENIQVIINRYMENDEINIQEVEDVLNKKVYWKIPNNYFTMMSAINKGVSVSEINPDSNVALSYKHLALTITDKIYKRRNDNAE